MSAAIVIITVAIEVVLYLRLRRDRSVNNEFSSKTGRLARKAG